MIKNLSYLDLFICLNDFVIVIHILFVRGTIGGKGQS